MKDFISHLRVCSHGACHHYYSQNQSRCAPGKKAPPPPAPAKPLTQAELKAADIVSQDKIWRQSVNNEQTGLKRWENAWGFLTEFDPKVKLQCYSNCKYTTTNQLYSCTASCRQSIQENFNINVLLLHYATSNNYYSFNNE